MYKSKLNRTVKKSIISLVLFVVIIGVLGVAAWVTLESNTSKPEGALYQYFVNNRIDYENGSKLSLNDFGEAQIEIPVSGSVGATDTSPVYYAEEDRFILPVDMTYVNAYTSEESCVPVLSEFTIEDGKVYYLGYGDEKLELTNGFLYDGTNTYVFLEDVTVYLMETPIDVSAFSFIQVTSKGSYVLYEYESQELKTGELGVFEARMVDKRERYEVFLSYDKAILRDGVERLLFVLPERLDLLVG